MIRLLYFSTLVASTTAADVDKIVADAAKRNAEIGVTGLLAIESRRVCQILEGEDQIISDLYASIERDPRHRNVVEMDRRSITERGYPDWTMVRRPMIDMVMAALPANEV